MAGYKITACRPQCMIMFSKINTFLAKVRALDLKGFVKGHRQSYASA